jgi:hypothetical protein
MSLAINKILVAGANANSEGAYFQAETITVPKTLLTFWLPVRTTFTPRQTL